MNKPVVKVGKVRVRAFVCKQCSVHNEVLGEGPAPLLCMDCGFVMPKEQKPEYDIVNAYKKVNEPHG